MSDTLSERLPSPPGDRALDAYSQIVTEVAARVRSAYLGVAGTPAPLPPSLAERTGQRLGLRVLEVVPDGPAARAGLHQGDLVLTVTGQPMASAQSLQRLMLAEAIGSQMPITVVRNGALLDLIARPAELTDEPRSR